MTQKPFRLASCGVPWTPEFLGDLRTELAPRILEYQYFDKFEEAVKIPDLDLIRVFGAEREKALHHRLVKPTKLEIICQGVDTVWPQKHMATQLLFREGIHNSFMNRAKNLDTLSEGLILGSGFEALISLSIMVEVGFNHVTLIVKDLMQAEKDKIDYEAYFFGVKFDFITDDQLILLSAKFSAFAICEDLANQEGLLAGLLYFNYLKKKGLIWAVTSSLELQDYCLEADVNGLIVISPDALAKEIEKVWLDQVKKSSTK